MREADTDMGNDDEFDTLLRTALAERPEPATVADFAARAMAMATPLATPAATVARPARAPAWPIWLATVAILGMICFGLSRLSELGLAADSSTSDSSFTDSTSTDTTLLFEVGLVVFIASVVWAVTRSAFEMGGNERTLTVA